eukprot:1388359-Heterocapsa_arctica.AAC.1
MKVVVKNDLENYSFMMCNILNDQFKMKIEANNGLENYCFMMCKIEICNLCEVLVPYCDLHVFYMNKEDLQTLHGLIQYYVMLDEMAEKHINHY